MNYLTVFDKINSIVDANVAAGNNAESYKGAADQCQLMMEQGGFLDPQKLVEIAKKKLSENPTDFDTQLKTFNMLKSANMKSDPSYLELAEKIYAKEPSLYLAQYLANQASIAGDYTKAIQYIQDANGYATTAAEKADNFLTIAQIYQRKGDFSSARTYAYKAAEARSGWGEPYILIGDLYAASGSRCGSGTGWESQVVTWAAIDMWTKAKNIDGSVAGTAQSKINKYAQYMPTKADIFLRNLNVGDSYSIGCWIGVTTTVRSSD
ncbi:MAG: hypothetical protein LRY27_03910 [Chitinophagales bacterium]|nr:hypothetical protein [Chitinophagales bacterium]